MTPRGTSTPQWDYWLTWWAPGKWTMIAGPNAVDIYTMRCGDRELEVTREALRSEHGNWLHVRKARLGWMVDGRYRRTPPERHPKGEGKENG